jgi:hypothetical protein
MKTVDAALRRHFLPHPTFVAHLPSVSTINKPRIKEREFYGMKERI